ncbi:hypothetical protein VCRA2126O85_160052 [Vibrio crassostreae]|nr:hypothetical protein VCRA2128O106_150053 [Vibrio crassostreae]CAK2645751.1 hypothetical protein VCRA2125O83_150052 [Vibrio crassostreae]CAK2648718.1 hypothetical protein VCRA2128O100_160041 [Vibrio crassostreae]CAK2653113.1 hypothetical protein VCRA2126O84_160053 [Vibrio crassostreae]CAK2654955.1 hypothetical protein VCRA2127O91_160053 [Vibrio crassostreae]
MPIKGSLIDWVKISQTVALPYSHIEDQTHQNILFKGVMSRE